MPYTLSIAASFSELVRCSILIVSAARLVLIPNILMQARLDGGLLLRRELGEFAIKPGILDAGGPCEKMAFHCFDHILWQATPDRQETRGAVFRDGIVAHRRFEKELRRRRLVRRAAAPEASLRLGNEKAKAFAAGSNTQPASSNRQKHQLSAQSHTLQGRARYERL